jgi:hypothetical protein
VPRYAIAAKSKIARLSAGKMKPAWIADFSEAPNFFK